MPTIHLANTKAREATVYSAICEALSKQVTSININPTTPVPPSHLSLQNLSSCIDRSLDVILLFAPSLLKLVESRQLEGLLGLIDESLGLAVNAHHFLLLLIEIGDNLCFLLVTLLYQVTQERASILRVLSNEESHDVFCLLESDEDLLFDCQYS